MTGNDSFRPKPVHVGICRNRWSAGKARLGVCYKCVQVQTQACAQICSHMFTCHASCHDVPCRATLGVHSCTSHVVFVSPCPQPLPLSHTTTQLCYIPATIHNLSCSFGHPGGFCCGGSGVWPLLPAPSEVADASQDTNTTLPPPPLPCWTFAPCQA